MDSWFEELSFMRKKFVESARENNFDKGIRHSTVEKYPDPVHFVYELLQNAEDQGATEAQFALSADHLVFRHNGNPFKRFDVGNITGIGNSDKPQEANKIGRFGIGFKSVFAITDRPEVYTMLEEKPFAFAIEDLVVPVAIQANYENSNLRDTQFIFPFIEGQEFSLYSKIRKRLSVLGFETLLFLRNLDSITWQTETERGVYFCEGKGLLRRLRGERSRNEQPPRQNSANYLVFTRNVSLSENDRELNVSIAYRLDEKGMILSEPGQKLIVYFPTEQVTGLNFRLHGPFLLTDNRATIKSDNKINNKLIQECAALLGESIHYIKNENLLTVDFLSMLPIRKDNIPSLFQPLYDQLLQVLKRYRLLPTIDGTFASAKQIKFARSADLRELINERQLSTLYETSTPLHWLTSDITSDKTRDLYTYIIKELEVESIDPESFARKLGMSFLKLQPDEWLVQLYIFLSKQPALKETIKWKPILRLKDNSQVPPFKRTSPYDKSETPNAYLLREGKSKFPLVKRSLLVNDAVYAFLKEIGLSEPDIVDEVLTYILPSYEAGKFSLDNEARNRQNLKFIQDALLRTSYQKRHELIARLSKVPFIQASNATASDRAWKMPCEVYSRTKELLTWFEGNEQTLFITGSFPKSLLNDLNIPTRLQPRAKPASGTTGHVMIRNEWGFNQRGLHGFDPGANIDGLQQSLELITIEKAKILWNILLKYRYLIKGVVETSKHKDFRNPGSEERFSQIGLLCSMHAWLPNQNGDFCFPEELFLTDLPKGFEKSTDEAHELAIKLGMRKAEELQLADILGIPHEVITLIQRNPKKILALYQEQERKKVSLPSSLTNDPDRRREKAMEAANQAEEKTYKAGSVNRRISVANIDPKTYLRSHHTNAEGQLICQLCNQSMPFCLPNGEEYFEAYQYIEVLEKEYEANHLALCPNCAAEFQHACQTDKHKRAELILNVDSSAQEENLVVYIDMPVHRRLRFTQRHLIDLQAAIKYWLESGLDV